MLTQGIPVLKVDTETNFSGDNIYTISYRIKEHVNPKNDLIIGIRDNTDVVVKLENLE